MQIRTVEFISLLRKLLSESAETRARASDATTDWVSEYSRQQAHTVVSILLWLAEQESDENALETELNAAAELAGNREIDRETLLATTAIDPRKLTGSSIEHYDYLISLLDTA
ncbi:hypothetical protein [Nocardia sp. NPDC057030]|uniref:hypothetical protein n=1 Tax=unclassified Nocardia TaxID=2637762 RepID=UPI003639943C